jgi:hypothetical protein
MVLRPIAAFLAALVLAPAASAAPAPQDLHAFLLRATEAGDPTRTFARTPAFAWKPVNGATGYEFQLSSSRSFAENAIVWENEHLLSPVTTVPLTLPWTTGAPYSFYARVRATLRGDDVTPWSERYGFRMRAPSPPASLSGGAVNPRPGMVRWTPVEGATAYQVAFLYDQARGENKLIKTATTAADLREYYTLHNWVPTVDGPVQWRVRAVRELEGRTLNDLPAVSYGPWSPNFTTVEPPLGTGSVSPAGAVSRSGPTDVEDADMAGAPEPHELVPGFWWTGRYSLPKPGGQLYGDCPPDVAAFEVTCFLFHVYVYTDEDCTNRVHVSDLVGSPAYVPRLTGPLAYPGDTEELGKVVDLSTGAYLLLGDGEAEGEVFDAGGEKVFAAGLDPSLPAPVDPPPRDKAADRRTGLWDSDWPDGRYYWTVVPAVPRITPDLKVEYRDVEFGEEMCRAGETVVFRKTSAPAIERANGIPFASGMVGSGIIRGAQSDRPQFFGRVVVAWKPAPGAAKYEVQWSRKANPFRPLGSVKTASTAAMLGLDTGVWYYRVRGLDRTIPGRLQGMTWSDPQYVRIAPRTFRVAP